VDNREIFEKALEQYGYDEYFKDFFGGKFGHCTEKGNRLLGQNIAGVILEDVFGSKFSGDSV
jgi:hypothetical protein